MGGSYSTPTVPTKWFHDFEAEIPSMKGKTLAITGTTGAGLGFFAARTFASKGGTLIMLNRPSDRAKKAVEDIKAACPEGGAVTHIDCDLQSFDSVRSAADAVKSAVGASGLDVLCNNAGIMMLPDKPTGDGYEQQMQTNHLSHFLLTSLLMPALETAAEAKGSARVVNHTSMARLGPPLARKYLEKSEPGSLGGDGAAPRMERYHQTKLANCVFTEALQDRLDAKKSKVMAVVAAPGVAASDLFANTTSTGDKGLNIQATLLMKASQSPEDGSMPLLQCICGADVKPRAFYLPSIKGIVGTMFGDPMRGPPQAAELGDKCTSAEAKEMLWQTSEAACGPFSP